jgi:hypothetical protein
MMNAQINRAIGVFLMAAVTCLAACGDATDGEGGAEGTAPTISNLSLSPETINVGEQTQVQGNFEFEDADGDAAKLKISVTPPDGPTQSLGSIELQNGSNTTGGPATAVLVINPPRAGQYEVLMRLEDQAGNESNELSASLTAADSQ